jgi:XTP/dITP diphosphohydrolase
VSTSSARALAVVALATKNEGKVREIASILGDACTLVAPDPAWIPPEETEPDYRGNALLKARALVAFSGMPCLADDSGIEVDALAGAPGPRSARFAGDNATDAENLAKLVEVVRATPPDARRARYRCAAVLATPDGAETIAEDTVEGTLITEARGTGGFGYDPIFVPDANPTHTMAELTPSQKDAISHRGKAFRALIPALRALAR